MDCERFDKNCMDLLYGELDELTEAALMRHLHHCTRCRSIWGHLKTTRELAQVPLEDPPSDLLVRIVEAEKLAHRSLPLRERYSRTVSILAGYAMRPQVAMAALLVLMVGSSLIFVRAQPTGQLTEDVLVVERGMPTKDDKKPRRAERAPDFPDQDNAQRLGLAYDEDPEAADLPRPSASSKTDEIERQGRASYAEAMAAYQHGRYAEAERLFSEVASAGGPQAASAALHEGHAARNGSGCQRAASIYDVIAAKTSTGTISQEAAWHAASCYRAMGQTSRAVTHYKNLARGGAFSARALQALSEIEPQEVAQVTPASTAATDVGAGNAPVAVATSVGGPQKTADPPETSSAKAPGDDEVPKSNPEPPP